MSLGMRTAAPSESALEQGLKLLAQVRQENFKRAETLDRCYQALRKAMQQTPALPEPALGMGYLLLSLGDTRAARLVLEDLLRRCPDNRDAQRMLEQLSRQAENQRADRSQLDFDALYDELERDLLAQTWYYLTQVGPLTLASVRAPAFGRLERKAAEIESCLALLDAEHDINQLQKRFYPLQLLARRHRSLSRLAVEFDEVSARIEASRQLAESLIARLEACEPGSVAALELEPLLDQCDALADQLDLWEEKKQDISSLLKPYQALVRRVNTLQELIDAVSS